MGFCIFEKMCNFTTIHFRTFSSPPKRSPAPISNHFWIVPFSPQRHTSLLSVSMALPIWDISWMDSSNMWSFVTGFFYGAHLCSLWPNNIQLHGYTTPHFLESLINWIFSHFLSIMNIDAMKINVQSFFFLFLWENINFLYTPNGKITRSWDGSVYLLRNYQTIFHSGHIFATITRECLRAPISPHLSPTCYFFLILAILISMKWYLIVLSFHFLKAQWCWTLFHEHNNHLFNFFLRNV